MVVLAASAPKIRSASVVTNPRFPEIGLVEPNVSTYIPNDVGEGPAGPCGVLITICSGDTILDIVPWFIVVTVVVAGVAPVGAFIEIPPAVFDVGFEVGSNVSVAPLPKVIVP